VIWWIVGGAAVFIVALAALSFVPTFTRDRPEHPPEPPPRARDITDPPEMAWVLGLDADTLPHIRFRVAAEHAADTIADIPITQEQQ
jgi:hypothetical protein